MSKPTNLAEWGDTSTNITEPSNGFKAAGWAAGATVLSAVFNWWMNVIYTWIIWLNAFESTAHTWTALQTFSSGVALPAPTIHKVGAGGEPAFATFMSSTGAPGDSLCFFLDNNNVLHIDGWLDITNSTSNQPRVFTLPVGFRPVAGSGTHYRHVTKFADFTSKYASVDENGNVFVSGPVGTWSAGYVFNLTVALHQNT